MPYLDEAGLAHYDPKLKEWISAQPVKTIPSSLYPWTLTEKAGAVSCWPVGGTELKPTVDFLFTETGPASGDKGPENPSTISGVSSVNVTRCGKNILKTPYYSGSVANSTVTITPAADGTLTITKVVSSSNIWYNFNNNNIGTRFSAGTTFILSGTHTGGTITTEGWAIYIFEADGSTLFSQTLSNTSVSFTLDHDAFLVFRLFLNKNHVCSDVVLKPQIEIGSTATSFEPYAGADYTLPLGNTYYGGSIDLATGLMTVTHVKIVFTGAEEMSWGVTHQTATTAFSAGAPWRSYIPAPKTPSSGPVCTHFPFLYNSGSDTVHFYVFSVGGAGFWYPDPDMTEAEWKAYLAAQYTNGTPVTLCYEVDVPTTIQLTPTEILSLAQADKYTPRLNTIYTDASAVQVGYVKSPIREEFELQQAIVAQGGEI